MDQETLYNVDGQVFLWYQNVDRLRPEITKWSSKEHNMVGLFIVFVIPEYFSDLNIVAYSMEHSFYNSRTPHKISVFVANNNNIIVIKIPRITQYQSWLAHKTAGNVYSGTSSALWTTEPGFDSRSRRCMSIWFPVQTCFRRFFSGYSGFPPASKTGLLK